MPKLDCVMWTKNGEKTIGSVLQRINEAIPEECINQKFIVDDHSSDSTREIAQVLGWSWVFNEGSGISDGANTALKFVESDLFCSFEQDLLLNPSWLSKMLKLLSKPKVAIASGMRFIDKPKAVGDLQRYVARKYRGEQALSPWLKSREWSKFTMGKSLDNTLYRTSVMREVGGYPQIKTNAGVDMALAYKLDSVGYQWTVDYSVQSVHLRRDLKHELEHQYWYGTQLPHIWKYVRSLGFQPYMNHLTVAWRLYNSPFTGLLVALKMRNPSVALVHPLMRFYFTRGLLKSGGKL